MSRTVNREDVPTLAQAAKQLPDETLRRVEWKYAARVKELAAKAAERAATEAAAARRR